MSFSDDLTNFVHNYPYTNYHECVLDFLSKLVQELKKICEDADLEHLPDRLNTIDSLIASNTNAINILNTESAQTSQMIRDINDTLRELSSDVDGIHEEIDGVIDQLSEAVEALENQIDSLESDYESFKTATSTAIYNLNQAAFDPSQIVMTNNAFNYAISTLNGNSRGMRIVVDGSGSASDSIQWVDGGQYDPTNIPQKQKFTNKFKIPRFYSSGNACHLVIPSVFPIKYSASINWGLYFYANRWIGGTNANIGIVKVGAINFTDLLTEGGYTNPSAPSSGSACFNDMELFPNLSTGCYDLYIYNGRNGKYCWIDNYMFSSIMILPLDLGTMTQPDSIQRYFNLLNTYAIQATTDVDSKISSAISGLRSDIESQLVDLERSSVQLLDLDPLSFEPSTGVSLVSNNSYWRYQYDNDTLDRLIQVVEAYVDITVSITDLGSDSLTVGVLDMALATLSNNGSRSLSVDILHANNGAYGNVTYNGTVNIHAYGSFDSSTTVRIHGSFADRKILST